jgi:Aspartyl protease
MTQIMGAVYTKIKLTNAIDEALISRGLLAPSLLGTCEVDALVDTGSTYLVISPEILQKLGLRIIGQQIAKCTEGQEHTVGVTEALLIELLGAEQPLYALVTGAWF